MESVANPRITLNGELSKEMGCPRHEFFQNYNAGNKKNKYFDHGCPDDIFEEYKVVCMLMAFSIQQITNINNKKRSHTQLDSRKQVIADYFINSLNFIKITL